MPSITGYIHHLTAAVKKLSQSGFIKDVMLLFGGALIAQIVSMGSAPVVTRLFTPQNLGVFALFSASVNIFSVVSSLCYERAIVLPKENKEAINILALSIWIHLGFSLAVFLILMLLGNKIGSLLKVEINPAWIWLIPLGIFLAGLGKNFRFWRIRNKHFKTISMARIFEAVSAATVKITLGIIIGSFAEGLIAGVLTGVAVLSFILYSRPVSVKFKDYKANVSREKIKELARRYKTFPLFASWNVLMNQFSSYIIVFMFSFFFDAAIVGFYSLCNRFLGRPVSMVSQSVQNAYFQKAAENLSKGANLKKNYKSILFGLAMIGAVPFLVLTIWGEHLFVIIFGQDWATAGQYVQVMAPWYFITFIISPTNVIYEVCQKQNIRLGFNITITILRFVALLIGYGISKDPLFTILLFVIANVLVNTCLIGYSFVVVHRTTVFKDQEIPTQSEE